MLLYDSTNLFLAAAGLWRSWQLRSLEADLYAGAVLGGVMLALYFLAQGGLGEGDVKLAGVLGLWLGVAKGLACLLLAFTSAAFFGGIMILCRRAGRGSALPFGPFLCTSAFLCYLYGERMISLYWKLFL